MARQVEVLRSDKQRVEKELERQKQESAQVQEKIQARDKEIKTLAASQSEAKAEAKDISTKLNDMKDAKEVAEKATEKEIERRRDIEARMLRVAKIASIIVAIFASVTFILVVHYVWRWDWLLNHPNSYGLQGCVCLFMSFGIVGLWVKPWRKALWVTGFSGVVFIVLQILGGPGKNPRP